MNSYFIESIRKFKNDILSKGIYDIVKWLVIILFIFVFTNLVPAVDNLLSSTHVISLYWIVILVISFTLLTIIIVSSVFRNKISKILKKYHTDELTGLKNKHVIKAYLNQKIDEFRTKDESMSIILLDIDNFKKFNTEMGHNSADQIIRKVGELLRNDKRVTDETFRYFTGDEFLVVACYTSLSQALQAADRKRDLIHKNLFAVNGKKHIVTVSCGVAEFKKDDDYISFTNRAIEALNEAKKVVGKNNTKSIV
ncbi:GGDEF domain-containing protein [Cryomorpha ignava]|uniref:diguanylate cyclase n=2 Tax=Cryomorpha ignava TaxID=101383 RepID=A0A7K3WSJ5_9FLAO|nr:GGDEF domain-containing protein [Cryomorpha ignava]